jgi:two-component system, LytTR family, response regulator
LEGRVPNRGRDSDGVMIRVLVADDQPMARERLVSLLAAEPGVHVAATAATGPETVESIRQSAPDLVFLDLQMPGMDGFGVIEEVGVERMPPTVFVTAYDEYAVRAFEVHALDYLLKPFGRDRFQSALARARKHLERDRQGELAQRFSELLRSSRTTGAASERLLIKAAGRVSFVDVDAIDWIEAEGNYVRIHCGTQVHQMRATMNDLAARIGDRQFFRIHRSRIVNVSRVKELVIGGGGDYQVVLLDGTCLGLSRLYRDALEEQLTRR